MAWLPDGEKISKISLFVLAQLTNVTDRQTDGHRVTAYTALMHRAVKMHSFFETWCICLRVPFLFFVCSTDRRRHNVFNLLVRPIICYQTSEQGIFKTNKPILMKIDKC